MNKETLLNEITEAAKNKMISQKELLAAYYAGQPLQNKTHSASWATLLSLIGGAIVFLGIVILIAQRWSVFSGVERISITLGSGFLFYVTGVFFERDKRVQLMSLAFFFLAALLIPLGIAVTFTVAGFDPSLISFHCKVSLISLIFFLFSWFIFKRELFLLFAILYGTYFYFSLVNLLYTGHNPDIHIYLILLAGVIYILLGNYLDRFKMGWTGLLYCLGVFWFLGALFWLGLIHKGSQWEWIFPFMTFFVIYVGVLVKSSSFLAMGTLFLIAYLIEITDRYFSASLSWPLALVVMGFLLMAIGYFYFQVKKKYFK